MQPELVRRAADVKMAGKTRAGGRVGTGRDCLTQSCDRCDILDFCLSGCSVIGGMSSLRRARRVLSFCAMCVAASALGMAGAPVAAFEIFGLKLFEDPNAVDATAVIADPQPYSVVVAVNGDGALDDVVRNASALVADADQPASGAAGLLAKARGDY